VTFATLLQHPVTIVKPGVKLSRAGDEVLSWEGAPPDGPIRTANKAWVTTTRVFEDENLLDTSEDEVQFFFLPSADIANEDRIEWESRTYVVVGPPVPRYTLRGLHHFEVKGRRING